MAPRRNGIRAPASVGTPVHLTRRRIAVGVLVAMSIATSPGIASAGSSAATIRWDAPTSAVVGERVVVRPFLDGARDVAGFELEAHLDGGTVGVATAGGSPLARPDRAGHDLSLSELSGRAVIGAFTTSGSASGDLALGEIVVVPSAPGPLVLHLDEARFVDEDGKVVAVDYGLDAVRIDVVGAVGIDVEGAADPAAAAATRTRATTPKAGADDEPDAMTADGRIDALERVELLLEWQEARLAGERCGRGSAPFDVNGDGCVDVADLIRAARWPDVTTTETTTTDSAMTSAATKADSGGTFVVTDATDDSDTNIGNGTCRTNARTCSLRGAMQEANAHAGPDTINFAIPGSGPHVINVTRRMPRLTDPAGTTIDGYTQHTASPNTDPVVSNADIQIEVVGADASLDAFVMVSANNVLRGLSVYGFRRPVWIFGPSASDNRVIGCFIGTDSTGTYASSALVAAGHGIHVEQNAPRTVIGGAAPADRNVISGNGRHGVGLWHTGTDGSIIRGNIVGLSPLGDRAVPNLAHGIDLNFGVSGTTVGGTGPGERNVISGNGDTGIEVSHTSETTANVIAGNYIGTDVTGAAAPGYAANVNLGMHIQDGARANVIEDNVIGNNPKGGITLIDGGTNGVSDSNVIRGNRVGVSTTGAPIGNGLVGIAVNTSGTTIGPDNIIAYNSGPGVRLNLDTALRNRITRNSIYSNAGLGIDLAPTSVVNANDTDDLDEGPNRRLNFPVIDIATTGFISGTACPGCTVELFRADGTATNGSGQTYRASRTAGSSGVFQFTASGFTTNELVTATATDAEGNTSEFARNRTVV